jgi:hypothetical protein
MLWDVSKYPKTNDREAKVGAGIAQRAASYFWFDDEGSQRALIADGIGGSGRDQPGAADGDAPTPPDTTSIQTLNPDHWVPRLTEDRGTGKAGTWDVRLSIDATNPQDSRSNLGMMVIDSEDEQLWGWLSDLVRVTERIADISDRELEFTPAGFLDALYPPEKQGVAWRSRGNIALSVHENLGAVTDGSKIGSLSRILAWPGAQGGGTQAGTGTGGGRPSSEEELCLNAHAPRRYPDGKMLCWPIIDKAEELEKPEGKRYAVKFYEGQKGSEQVFMGRDGNSNFSAFPKNAHPQLAAFVQVPTGPS